MEIKINSMPGVLVIRSFILGILLSLFLVNAVLAQDYAKEYEKGLIAFQDGDLKEFLFHLKKADSLRPNHRLILHKLATAFFLNQQPEKAYQTLKYRIGFYAVDDFSDDENLSSLENSLLEQLKKLVEKYNITEKKSNTAFVMNIKEFHPEGIGFNQENERFYLTDIRHGWIYSFQNDGKDIKKELDLKDFGYWSAMGIKFDPIDKNILWVTTSAIENFIGYEDSLSGRSAVLKFDLEKKKLIKAYHAQGSHLFGDIVVSKKGNVIITDSSEPTLYSISPEKDGLTKYLSYSEWWNLQGLDFSESEEYLFVSDYINGIYKIDMKTGLVEPVSVRNELLRGADGIYISGNSLVSLHNGSFPKRVGVTKLNKNGTMINMNPVFPDNALSELNEPTLGVIVGSELFYIANSPWAHYERGKPLLEKWKPILINKLSVK